jgi:tetratricopeptide (TPR) repeat protein
VGDHGEALGEHGERGHGIFLYRASLEVPLILAGAGVPAGRVVEEAVGTARLAPTLLALADLAGGSAVDGAARRPSRPGAGAEGGEHAPGGALAASAPLLPGLPALGADPPPQPVYSETWMPATAYGWSPLKAVSDAAWRLIVAPRPELYEVARDPGETRNLIDGRRPEASRLKRALARVEAGFVRREAARPEADPQLAAALRSLGYLSGASGSGRRDRPAAGAIDPKDGIALLADFDRGKELLAAGRFAEAAALLSGLVGKNPGNVPFLTQLARAQMGAGAGEAAIATYRRAVGINPGLDFLHLNLAQALRQLGRAGEAKREFALALELNPRAAAAWLALAEMAHLAGDDAEERRLLVAAADAGTASAALLARLGQVETVAGDPAAGDERFRAATELAPEWAGLWLLWGQLAESRGATADAVERYRGAVAAAPDDPAALLRLGRALRAAGDPAAARPLLERAADLAGASAVGREARALLAGP